MIDPIRYDDDDDDDEREDREDEREKDRRLDSPAPLGTVMQTLYKARTVMIFGEINQKLAAAVVAQLLALAHESDDDIRVFINSQGGHVESGDSIHDVIRFIRPRVVMIGTGWVASAGTHIFLGARKEDRYCLPNTRFMIHQPLGGLGGVAADIAIEAKEIIRVRRRLNEVIARETGQPLEKVERDTDRNYWLTAEEARDYGLVSHLIRTIDEVK